MLSLSSSDPLIQPHGGEGDGIDVVAIEQSGGFRGCYFVLMGTISPLDGIGPEKLGIDRLLQVLDMMLMLPS